MNKTGKEPAKHLAPAPETPESATPTPKNNEAETTIRETKEEIRNVETKVEREDQGKTTSGEKLQS